MIYDKNGRAGGSFDGPDHNVSRNHFRSSDNNIIENRNKDICGVMHVVDVHTTTFA